MTDARLWTRRAAIGAGAAGMTACASAGAPEPTTDLFVVSTLYRRHETTPAYDLAILGRVLSAIDPHVLVLDVTPGELERRAVHASKIEYPGAVFPFIEARRRRAYAAEPDEPLFSALVRSASESLRAFAAERPEASAALIAYEEALFRTLRDHWTNAAAVNDALTDQMMAAKYALDSRLVGAARRDGQAQWDEHGAQIALQAAAENPGKRILMLTGVYNAPRVRGHVRASQAVRAVDVAAWLGENGL